MAAGRRERQRDPGVRAALTAGAFTLTPVAGGGPGGQVLFLAGVVDTYNAGAFLRRVTRLIEAGCVRLVLHCGKLTRLSAAGVGAFTALLKAVRSRGGDLVLLGARPEVYETFRLLGFAGVFTFRENLEEAARVFAGEAVFPRVFACPACARKLRAERAGRFRCGRCGAVLALDGAGEIFFS